MKKAVLLLSLSGFISFNTYSQVGIGTDTPTNKLHIVSDTDPLRLEGLQSSVKDTVLVVSGNGILTKRAGFGLAGWQLAGNSGTVPGSQFLGTTDAADLIFKVNNQQTARFQASGNYLALGHLAGANLTAGGNVALGTNAMTANTNAAENIAIGMNALAAQSFSNNGTPWNSNNIAVGNGALQSNQPTGTTHGVRNTAIGNQTLNANIKGTENTAVGYRALYSNTNGGYNVALGNYALYTQSYDGNGFSFLTYNTAIGHSALYSNQPAGANGFHNVAIGFQAMYLNTIGSYNTSLGNYSMYSNLTGQRNVAIGHNALYANNAGTNNISIGVASMKNNTAASSNIAIGQNALFDMSYNGGSGAWSTYNVAIGDNALSKNQPTTITNGRSNTAVGFNSMFNNTTGYENTAIGDQAMFTNTTGSRNTALGMNAFFGVSDLTNTTAIGYDSRPTVSNQVRLGNANITSLVCTGAYAATSAESPNVVVNSEGQIMRSTVALQVKMTAAGGMAIAMTNASGSSLPKGTIVMASTSDNSFTVSTSDCEVALGALAEDCSAGATGWVIVSGIAEVLVKDGQTAAAGSWAGCSDSAGKAYFVAGSPGLTQHDREIGHCIQTVMAGTGVMAKVVLHLR